MIKKKNEEKYKGEEVFDDVNPQIFVYAINGIASRGYKIMRVMVHVNKKALHIFIDSGSIHNFLDVEVAKKLGCIVMSINPMKIDVTNGSSFSCVTTCNRLTWLFQGTRFQTDLLLLPLGNCDMVLEVQWLETLREIR